MGTRANPGRFDAHAAALPDEPLFTLLARDPLAGFLVSIWSSMRFGDVEAARVKFRTMLDRIGPDYWVSPDVEKGGEAIEVAMAMFAWREANLGRWRGAPASAAPDLFASLDQEMLEIVTTELGARYAAAAAETRIADDDRISPTEMMAGILRAHLFGAYSILSTIAATHADPEQDEQLLDGAIAFLRGEFAKRKRV